MSISDVGTSNTLTLGEILSGHKHWSSCSPTFLLRRYRGCGLQSICLRVYCNHLLKPLRNVRQTALVLTKVEKL